MSDTISLFEAKAHLSDLVRRVAESGRGVLLTVRGKPMVRIEPLQKGPAPQDAWEVRERVAAEYGIPDFAQPPRTEEPHRNPFADE